MFQAGDDTYTDEVEALYTLQNLLLKRGEGQLGPAEDQKYINLRRGLMKLERYKNALPILVTDKVAT